MDINFYSILILLWDDTTFYQALQDQFYQIRERRKFLMNSCHQFCDPRVIISPLVYPLTSQNIIFKVHGCLPCQEHKLVARKLWKLNFLYLHEIITIIVIIYPKDSENKTFVLHQRLLKASFNFRKTLPLEGKLIGLNCSQLQEIQDKNKRNYEIFLYKMTRIITNYLSLIRVPKNCTFTITIICCYSNSELLEENLLLQNLVLNRILDTAKALRNNYTF